MPSSVTLNSSFLVASILLNKIANYVEICQRQLAIFQNNFKPCHKSTSSTGKSLSALGLKVQNLVSSGPLLGGDLEIGAMIASKKVAAVFFFTDPLSSHPHEADIASLNRICCVHDVMFANNPSSAQSLVFSLEYSAFCSSRPAGTVDVVDSDIVQRYQCGQQKVIAKVVENSTNMPSRIKHQ